MTTSPAGRTPTRAAVGPAAVLFSNGLGDHLLTLPALRALASIFPADLTLLTDEYPTELLLAGVEFTRTVKVAMSVTADNQRTFDAGRAAVQLGPIEWLVGLVPWHSSSVVELIEAMGPARSIGMHPGFGHVIPFDFSKHAADRAFAIVRHFDASAKLEDFTAPIPLPAASVAFVDAVRRELGDERRLLVVHAEASSLEKRWDPARMEETLRRVTSDQPDIFVIVVSRRTPCLDVNNIGESAVAATGISLGSFLAFIAAADLFLGVDSFGLHAADLWQVPAVGLFGPTSPAEYGFRFSTNNCHVSGGGDLGNITVEQVVDAVTSIATRSAELRQ